MTPDKRRGPGLTTRDPDQSGSDTNSTVRLPAPIPTGLEGVGQERVRAVRMVACTITEDTSRQVFELVDAGWPVAEARASAGRWWSSNVLVAIRDGLDEGVRRAAA